jgi:hypothetical protein
MIIKCGYCGSPITEDEEYCRRQAVIAGRPAFGTVHGSVDDAEPFVGCLNALRKRIEQLEPTKNESADRHDPGPIGPSSNPESPDIELVREERAKQAGWSDAVRHGPTGLEPAATLIFRIRHALQTGAFGEASAAALRDLDELQRRYTVFLSGTKTLTNSELLLAKKFLELVFARHEIEALIAMLHVKGTA